MLGQSGPGSNGNEGVLKIPQSSSITETSPLGHSLGCATSLQRSSRCILQPQTAGQYSNLEIDSIVDTVNYAFSNIEYYIINNMYVCPSLSLYIYIYIYIYTEESIFRQQVII